jgi:hypothetical protein
VIRLAFGLSVVAVALSGGVASAEQPPWAGGPPPIGSWFGYSPLVHSVDPFPSKTSPYYHSMFHPVYGGKRVYPSLLTDPRGSGYREPAVIITPDVPVVPFPQAGSVVQPGPTTRQWRLFGRR